MPSIETRSLTIEIPDPVALGLSQLRKVGKNELR